MTIDERIERLTGSQEKTETILATILDSIKRLERIAVAHTIDIEDLDKRLDEIEARRRQKPQ